MNPDHNFYIAHCVDEPIFTAEISKVFTTCDDAKRLMISIYLIEENRFLYSNKVFRKLIGFHSNDLLYGGWDFWFSFIIPNEATQVKNKILRFFKTPFVKDILTLQYHILDCNGKEILVKHEILMYKLKNKMFALNYLFDISEKETIERCMQNNGAYRSKNALKDSFTHISSREEEVLKLIADGFSSKEIAEKLFISNHTAISHRKHLIQKFRVKNTAQLIKTASKVLEL